jgi:Leucine-rich repeat (LRR) protein
VGWTGDVGTIANVNAATTTITMNGDYSITANFGRSYHLAISSSEGGNVTNPGEGIFTYGQGFIVTLRTLAGDGYRFVNWTGDVSTIANVNGASTTITMNGDYSVSANFKEDEVVTFIDHNLEAAVRAAIAKPESPIYTADMERLGSFSAQATGISSLTGLEYAANLMSLYLQYNQISDISPLANLTNLTQLHLEGNRISDISPLANLTNLKSLNLQYNPISDISPLVNNPGLSQGDEVYLSNNPLSSTSMNTYIPQLQGRGVVVYWP